VAQVFGAKPENFYKTAKLIKKLGFDGLDINMGCPDKKVIRQGAGAALIKNPKLAQKIILETKRGARFPGGQADKMPVSVKTRIGYDKYDKKEFRKWLIALLECEPSAITIHARTKKEMSLVPARWDIIAEAVKIRDEFFGNKSDKTLILGNGDIKNIQEAKEKAKETGADGVMSGRAVFGNPWLFAERKAQGTNLKKKLSVLLEHTKLFEKINPPAGGAKKFDVMKKHFKSYASGFPSAKELRVKLMACKNAKEVEKVLND